MLVKFLLQVPETTLDNAKKVYKHCGAEVEEGNLFCVEYGYGI